MRAAQQQLDSGVDGRMTEACPSCGLSRSIYCRQQKEPKYKCADCKHVFDEPERRPANAEVALWNLSRSNRFLLWAPKTASIDELPELFDQFIEGGDGS